MKLTVWSATFAFVAGQALGGGLGCEKPGPVQTFLTLDAVPHQEVIVAYGKADFDETLMPDPFDPAFEQPIGVSAPIPTILRGKSLTPQGFTQDFQRAVNFEIICANYACGTLAAGQDMLFFLPAETTDQPIGLDQCDNVAFYDPAANALEMLESCIRGDVCTPLP